MRLNKRIWDQKGLKFEEKIFGEYMYAPHTDVSVNDGPIYGGGPIRLQYHNIIQGVS
jgi:hypothetical protein